MRIPAPMQIPAILRTATVSPCFAILVSREALPFRFVEKEEKTSFCKAPHCQLLFPTITTGDPA